MNDVTYAICLDDDPMPAKLIEEALGLRCFGFSTCQELVEVANKFDPIGAFIDIHLRDECGLDVIPQIRSLWPSAAIIAMTGDLEGKLVGPSLASGADDFIRKPIDPSEAVARLTARVEDRRERAKQSILTFGNLRLDMKQKLLFGNVGQLSLSNKVMEILVKLISANGLVVPKDVLMRDIWGGELVSANAIDRRVFEVRKAIRTVSDSVELQSIYGVGMVLKVVSGDLQSQHIQNLERIMKGCNVLQ